MEAAAGGRGDWGLGLVAELLGYADRIQIELD